MAPPGAVSVSVTLVVAAVTVLPSASWTATTGCVPRAVPPVPLLGWVVNASLAAAPAVIVKVLLVAEVSDPSVAVRV